MLLFVYLFNKKVLESELKRKATQVKIKDETIDELKIQVSLVLY